VEDGPVSRGPGGGAEEKTAVLPMPQNSAAAALNQGEALGNRLWRTKGLNLECVSGAKESPVGPCQKDSLP
jgi:hypothetical protein